VGLVWSTPGGRAKWCTHVQDGQRPVRAHAVDQWLFRVSDTYYMNTYEDPAIRSCAMSDFDMDSSELITAD
jgi:hypothetical protein